MMQQPDRFAQWLRAFVDADVSAAQQVALGNLQRLRWLIPMFLALNLLLLACSATSCGCRQGALRRRAPGP